MTVRRAQLKHLLLDNHFFEKPKIVALEFKFGGAVLMLYVRTLTDMCKATDAEIDEDVVRARAHEMGIAKDTAEEFILYALERGLYDRGSKPFLIFNRRVRLDQEAMAARQDKWKKAKRQQRDIDETDEGQNEDGTEKCEHLNIEDLNTEHLKSEDLKAAREPQIGLTKFLDHVYVNETKLDPLKMRFTNEGLGDDGLNRAVELLDRDLEKNPEKRRKRCMYKDLISWPLTQVKVDLNKVRRSQGTGPPRKSTLEMIREAKFKEDFKSG